MQLSVFISMSENFISVGQTAFTDRGYNFGSIAVQIMKKILNLSYSSRAVHVLRWDLSRRGGVQVSKMSAKTNAMQDEHLT